LLTILIHAWNKRSVKSLGLKDAKSWKTVINELANYTDADGLLTYFPIREGEGNHGSDVLTAYVLAASHEESSLHHSFELSEEQRAPLERGLLSFVQGRIQRDTWSPRKDLDIRKLAAIEALSRYGKAQGTMLNSITVSPNQWPTHAVIDWVNILRRVEDVPDRDKRLAQAHQVLRSRISFQGTKLIFNSESDDYWWWLMQNGDANSARLLLAVLDDPAWESDKARLASGLMGRLKNGAWLTTTANFWGGLALEKFSAKYETAAVSGRTSASLGANSATVDWTKAERNKSMFLPWGNPSTAESLKLSHQGSGKPWLTLQSLAAVRLKDPVNAGYQIEKTITAIEQANTQLPSGSYTRGDVIRVTLKIKSNTDMSWVAITDPVPAGATILGGGLGRDSEILTQGEKKEGVGWPVFESEVLSHSKPITTSCPRV
jgi:alpha-2-macroglobulin